MTVYPAKNPPGHARSNGRPRILILDDNSECLAMYAAVAESLNCYVHATADGYDALATLRDAEPFDLILLDLDMPAMNGVRFYNELKNQGGHRNLKIILTSSHPFAADIATALDLFAHAPKGASTNTLKELLIKALS